MYKILLDDNFYENTLEQNEYLKKLILSIKEYFDAKIVFFEPFYQTPKSYHLSSMSQIINKRIQDTRKVIKYNLNDVIASSNKILEGMQFSQVFIGKISYIIDNNPDDILIIPLVYNRKNRNLLTKNYKNRIYFIGNYDEEVESNIAKWIANNELINIDNSSFDNKFPAKKLCGGYDKWRSEILKPKYAGDKISDFTRIGFEVALRNNYTYDSHLSAINKLKAKTDKNGKHPKRQVFKNKTKDVYLSTDFENGGFEVYDRNAYHQGQYRFNGEFEKEPNSDSHPLYLK